MYTEYKPVFADTPRPPRGSVDSHSAPSGSSSHSYSQRSLDYERPRLLEPPPLARQRPPLPPPPHSVTPGT